MRHGLRNHVGHDLNRLRIDRNKADYDDSVIGLSSMAEGDLLLAERVIYWLDSL